MAKLIKMTKDGEEIDVNPLMVDAHKKLGWKVVGEEPEAEQSSEEATAEAPKSKRRTARSQSKKKDAEPEAPGE